MNREEIRLCETLDSLYSFGWPIELLLRTAKNLNLSWTPVT